MENENNLTSYTSEVNSTEKCQSYMEQIMNVQNENLIGILMSFLEYNDLINFQQTNKTIYNILKKKKFIKKYTLYGCVNEKYRLLFYMSNIDINKMKDLILKELLDYKIDKKLYENIRNLSNKEENTDKRLKKIYGEIERDINRTFYTDIFTKGNGNNILRNILTSVAFIRPEIGYCQGMNFIAGALINFFDNEEICFWIFLSFIDDLELSFLFLKNMPDYYIRIFQLNYYIKEYFPELFDHLQKAQINADLFFSKWILTIFSNYLPFNVLYKVWDVFIIDKWKAIFKFSMIFLFLMKDQLMKMDLLTFSQYFKSNAEYLNNMNFHDIIKYYKNYKVTNKKLKELRQDYFVEQVKEKLNDPKNFWESDQKEYIQLYKNELNTLCEKEKETKTLIQSKLDKSIKNYEQMKKNYNLQMNKVNKFKIKIELLLEMKNGLETVLNHRDNYNKKVKVDSQMTNNGIILTEEPGKINKEVKKSKLNFFKKKTEEEKLESKLNKTNKDLDSINQILMEEYQVLDHKRAQVEKLNKKISKYKKELRNTIETIGQEKNELLKNLSQKLKLSAKFVLTNKY